MRKKFVSVVLELLLTVLIVFGVSLLLTYIISNYKNSNFINTLSWVGLIIAIFGGLSLLKGNPTGANMGSIGSSSSSQTYNNYLNMEATRMERQITKYWDSTKNHGLLQFNNRRLFTMLGGIIVFLVSTLIM